MPGLIDPRYCCCAVPLVNAGIYLILTETVAVAVACGVLCFVAPSVTGVSVPSFAIDIFAVICWLVVVVQPAGFIGVFREKTTLFRIYNIINAVLTACALIVAAVLIIISAVHHDTAVSSCETTYFSTTNTTSSEANSTLTEEGKALCDAFVWADIGFMGGLWVILFICQSYFVYTSMNYSKSQVSDHKLYHSVYSENPEAFTMSILRSTRYNPGSVYNSMPPPGPHADAWDARPSFDSVRNEPGPDAGGGYYAHQHEYADPAGGAPHGEEGRYDDVYAEGAHAYPNTYEGYQGGAQQHGEGSYPFTAPGGGYVEQPGHEQPLQPGQHYQDYSSGSGKYTENTPGYPSHH